MDLSHRSDGELLSDVGKLVGSHRALTAKLVAHLAEIEERRLHLRAGFSSMFEFCVKELRLGEGEAFRRIVAARLVRRFPIVESLLASGAVHLSALELLREHLTDENHAELLETASGKTKREVEALVAARFPKPDVPARLRALPPAKARFEPLSETRYKLELTVSTELREKIELCRDLLSHANPGRELEAVLERAVDLLVADLERKRLRRTKRPVRAVPTPAATSRHVPNAARREVFERDGMQCTYVSPEGRRCEARAFLELDHAEPRGLGGGSDAKNLRVRCRAHNQLWAEDVFGRRQVDGIRHFRQKKWSHDRHGGNDDRATGAASSGTFEKVRLALTTMGFPDAAARQAVTEAKRKLDGIASLEQALREALAVATRRAA